MPAHKALVTGVFILSVNIRKMIRVLMFLPTLPLLGRGMPPMTWPWKTKIKSKE